MALGRYEVKRERAGGEEDGMEGRDRRGEAGTGERGQEGRGRERVGQMLK